MEERLHAWIISQRRDRKRVTIKRIIEKGQEFCKEDGATSRLGRGWADRFMKRKKLTKRRRTTIAQKSPADYLDKIVDFVGFVREKRVANKYKDGDIIGCDETPVWMEMPGKKTKMGK